MSELEEKLGTILSNPQLMQQIAAMAQSLGQSPSEPSQPQPNMQSAQSLPDPAILQSAAAMLQKSNVNQEQRELLQALSPFLSQGRLRKLERAMRAAKMADLASVFLKSGGFKLLSGR